MSRIRDEPQQVPKSLLGEQELKAVGKPFLRILVEPQPIRRFSSEGGVVEDEDAGDAGKIRCEGALPDAGSP